MKHIYKEAKMAKKTKAVECIQVDDHSGDGPFLWRLDTKNEGNRFFRFIQDNYEITDGCQTISVVRLTPAQWKKAEKLGEELS